MTTPQPGVLRRSARAGEVVERLTHPIIPRPVRNKGQFIVDSVFEANQEALDRKYLANRLRTR